MNFLSLTPGTGLARNIPRIMNNSESFNRSIAVGELGDQSRAPSASRTYGHLFGAVSAFTLIEVFLFKTGLAETIAQALLGVSWLLVLGGFVSVAWLASRIAHRAESKAAQYGALAAYVVAEAIIFVPLLYIADRKMPGAISSAAAVTFLGFAALTAVGFLPGKDFSFLRSLLFLGGGVGLDPNRGGVMFWLKLDLPVRWTGAIKAFVFCHERLTCFSPSQRHGCMKPFGVPMKPVDERESITRARTAIWPKSSAWRLVPLSLMLWMGARSLC